MGILVLMQRSHSQYSLHKYK